MSVTILIDNEVDFLLKEHCKFHYKTMELNEDATAEQIKTRYRELQRKYHPDKNSEDTNAISAKINDAYDILGNPEKKAQYDNFMSSIRKVARFVVIVAPIINLMLIGAKIGFVFFSFYIPFRCIKFFWSLVF